MYIVAQEEKRLKALKNSYITNFGNMKNMYLEIAQRVNESQKRFIDMAKKSMNAKYAITQDFPN